MFIRQLYLVTYSVSNPLTGHITVKDDETGIKTDLNLTADEVAQIFPVLERAYARHQQDLVRKMAAPLETMMLAPPIEAEFTEVNDGHCYCDGSSLWAREWLPVFLHEGSAGIFRRLEQYYEQTFNNGPPVDLTPTPRAFKD